MTSLTFFLLPIAFLAAPLAAHADDWKDERGNRRYDRAPKEVFWEGNCRVERKINRHGELMERRRCRGERDADARPSGADADDPERGRFSDDDEPQRWSDYRASRRYSGYPEPQPRRHSGYRDQRRYDTAPASAPAYRYDAPPASAPRLVAKTEPALKAPRMIAKPATVTFAPRVVAKAVPKVTAPRVVTKAKPVREAPRVIAKAAPIVKTSGNHPKSDWLVMLPPDQAKAKTVVKPSLVSGAAPLVAPRAKAKADRAWELREHEAYFKMKSRDPYSNLR